LHAAYNFRAATETAGLASCDGCVYEKRGIWRNFPFPAKSQLK
jgi:hypothetical protein